MVIQERNLRRTCQGMLVGLVCLLASLLFLHISAYAATTIKKGIVEVGDSRLNLRSEPNTSSTIVKKLYTGDTGVIVEERLGEGGYIWYYMEIMNVTGWARSDLVRVETVTIEDDKNFEEYMIAQGFPESYKPALRELHAQYPNWIFQAQQTGLNWSDVIVAESKLGKNLVSGGSISSWKSTQQGAYNWENSTWVLGFDTGNWVAASTEIIQYHMDPRNFLDDTNIFQFLRQSYSAAEYDEAGLNRIKSGLINQVKNTFLAGNCDGEPYADVIMRAAAAEGVNPYVLASMIIQEIGVKGDSHSISGTLKGYEGYYNYYNIAAYEHSGYTAIQNGLRYAMGSGDWGRPWNTRYKAIAGGAQYYASGYIKKGQDTMYLKKFNVQGSNLYGHQYMTNVQGAYSEGRLMSKAYDATARQGSLTFKIPVYKNMPANACPRPTIDGSPNYMLKSLSISGYNLTPTFSMYDTNYSLIVPNEVQSITVNAAVVDSTATISGNGQHSLQVGENAIKVTVKAQNGSTRVYTVNVVRQEGSTPSTPTEPQPPVIPTPSITSPNYAVNNNNTITGITTFPVSVSNFATKFHITNGTVKVTTSNGTEKSAGSNVGTGDQIRVYDGANALKFTYDIIIYGDTNGDGKISTLDYVNVRKDILGTKLQGLQSGAADTNRNGKIDTLDYVQIRKQILGQYTIQQ